MAQINETAGELNQTVGEMNQAVTRSITEAQQRSMKYAQSVFDSGVEVLKENTQDSRALMQSLMESLQEPQFQTVMDSMIAVQERNIKFAQGVIENGVEVLKSQVESNRTLMQTLVELSRKQQEAFQAYVQEPVKGYFESFTSPFSFYQKAVESAQGMTFSGMRPAQKPAHKATQEKTPAAATK